MIIKILMSGERQYSDLAREIPGLSARMLTVRLKELEDAGIVGRNIGTGIPVRVTYALTGKGEELAVVLDGIVRWGPRMGGLEPAGQSGFGRLSGRARG